MKVGAAASTVGITAVRAVAVGGPGEGAEHEGDERAEGPLTVRWVW